MGFPKFARMRKGEHSNWYFQLIGTLGKDVAVYAGGEVGEIAVVAACQVDGKIKVTWTLKEDIGYHGRTLVLIHEETFKRKVDLGIAELLTEASEEFRRTFSRFKEMGRSIRPEVEGLPGKLPKGES